jgi:hypothetical protein
MLVSSIPGANQGGILWAITGILLAVALMSLLADLAVRESQREFLVTATSGDF